jgi:hypothetical protein
VEVYDLNQGTDSKLANLSTRAFVSTGDNIVIAGFLLSDGRGEDRIVLRGIGPSLAPAIFPASAVLADPTLELRDTNGTLLISNNDWEDNAVQAAEITAAGLAPTNSLESAIAATLPPGLYTALLAGLNCGTGIGIVEIYDRGLASNTMELPASSPFQGCSDPTTPTPTPTPPTPTPTATPTPTPPTPTPTATPTPTPPTPTPTATPTPTPPTPTPTATPTPTPPTPTPTITPTPTPPTPTPTATPTPPTATPTPTPGPCIENFDGVPAPALPAGWAAKNAAGSPPLWVTSPTLPDTAPNSAVVKAPAVISDKRLYTRPIVIGAGPAQLSFRNNYDFQYDPPPAEVFWDGGVLEVSINGGPFLDIINPSIGGSFVSGGYNGVINDSANNPLATRQAWGANTAGLYINTVVNLGLNVIGQTIVLRFRMGTDQAGAAPGWRIDTFALTGGACP